MNSLVEQEGYLVNEIGLTQTAVVDLEINANGTEISFSVGYPGDKQVRDVLIPAQMIFSKDQAYQCADTRMMVSNRMTVSPIYGMTICVNMVPITVIFPEMTN